MRICIPLADGSGGGVASFVRNLRRYLDGAGIRHTSDPADGADIVFANAWTVSRATVTQAKRANPAARVLHRIDGSAADYGRDPVADVQQALVNLLADVTVFQSAYGREATRRRRVILADGPVIHNPVDVTRFRPDGERVALPGVVRIAHVTHSTNARKGAAGAFALARRRPDLAFVMVGHYPDAPALANVTRVGYADWERLPVILRSCDVLLTLSENETCPNVVLEALASGLPVLYRASGGTPELVAECGRPVEPATFDAALAEVLDRKAELGPAARARAEARFSFAAVFPRYLEAAAGAARRPTPDGLAVLATFWRVWPGAAWTLRRGAARLRRGHLLPGRR